MKIPNNFEDALASLDSVLKERITTHKQIEELKEELEKKHKQIEELNLNLKSAEDYKTDVKYHVERISRALQAIQDAKPQNLRCE